MKFILFDASKLPPRPNPTSLFRGFFGGFLAILTLEVLTLYTSNHFIMAPFGATCVLLFAASQSPLAQPRNVIFGHFISAFGGLVFLKFFDYSIFTTALAVGMAIYLMMLFRSVHPPAGANPLVILLTANQVHYGWDFLLFPVLSGSIILVLLAYAINNVKCETKWPVYWLAFFKNKQGGK